MDRYLSDVKFVRRRHLRKLLADPSREFGRGRGRLRQVDRGRERLREVGRGGERLREFERG
jgi:hypothetical protein